MGNLLIGGFGLLAIVVGILYFALDKQVRKASEGGWKDFFSDIDGEMIGVITFIAIALILIGWGICSAITHGMVSEDHKKQREAIVYSYKGSADSHFSIGRTDRCYLVMGEKEGKVEEFKVFKSDVEIVVSTLDANGTTGTFISEYTERKIKRSKMPFMFMSNKDKTKELSGCGCNGHYILTVPANYVFYDIP